jgi:hypothetical protein
MLRHVTSLDRLTIVPFGLDEWDNSENMSSGTFTAHSFDPDISKYCKERCPPSTAQPVQGVVYRGIREAPMTDRDFKSDAELRRNGKSLGDCRNWGLSVWTSEKAVVHARRTYRPLRQWHVASGSLAPADGVLLSTPTTSQPEHCTLWAALGSKLLAKFKLVMGPE